MVTVFYKQAILPSSLQEGQYITLVNYIWFGFVCALLNTRAQFHIHRRGFSYISCRGNSSSPKLIFCLCQTLFWPLCSIKKDSGCEVFGNELQLEFRLCATILVSVFQSEDFVSVIKCSNVPSNLIISNLMKMTNSAFQDERWFLSLNMRFNRKKRKSRPSLFLRNKLPPIPFLLFTSIFPHVFSSSVMLVSSLNRCLFIAIPFLSQDDGGKFWWGLVLSGSCYQLAPFAAKLFKPDTITLHISLFDLSIMEST